MIDVKKILEEEGQVRKLEGNAPEGFILVHEKTLEQLKDFDVWKSWIHNERTSQEMNKLNFENE
jgi:hypothetical protein